MSLIVEYHEDLEFDLHPKVDLLDFWRGKLSPRRLLVFIRRLPTDSFFYRHAYPDDARIATWGPTEYLLADLFDLTVAGLTAGSKQKPQPYPRPAEVVERQRATDARRKALIDRYVSRNGGDASTLSNLRDDDSEGRAPRPTRKSRGL